MARQSAFHAGQAWPPGNARQIGATVVNTLALPICVPVLDKGYLCLEDMMGGDAAVVRGARICYQSTAKSEGADERLIQRLMSSTP
ncbi:MAG: hypothetical protein ABFD20_05520, partial [Anaerolineales bacterium]